MALLTITITTVTQLKHPLLATQQVRRCGNLDVRAAVAAVPLNLKSTHTACVLETPRKTSGYF
eukprot:m.130662 g.130662  ORF g.130662 m.130662 type:complete len:63 (+) comp15881_c0_seq1:1195-1383(+)